MKNDSFQFTFNHAVPSQRELIHHWLQQGYIQEWIHGQGLKNTLDGLEKFFQYQAQGKPFDCQTPITQHWIGYHNEIPFVYLLTSNVLKNADDVYAKHRLKEGEAITLDIFIGEPAYLGKGLAAIVIKEFLRTQFPRTHEVFIDPEKNNVKAIHVYQKAGFKIIGEFIAPWHPVPHYLMKLTISDYFS